jgi:hypothetical protein
MPGLIRIAGAFTVPLVARFVAAAALALPCASFAVEPLNIKPGLWEVTQTMTMSGAPMYVEGMPEAGRANYAKQWAQQAGKPKTDVDQECITAKEIKEAKVFEHGSDESKQCKQTVSKQSSTAWVASSECKDAKTTNVVQLDYAAPSPERFSGTVKSTTDSPNGKTIIELKLDGKWKAASCPAEEEEEEEAGADSEP